MSEIAWPQEAHAICGAFLVIAFADGRFDDLEEARLLAGLTNHDVLKHLSANEIETVYNGLASAFRREYAATCEGVMAAISGCRHDQRASDAIVTAARMAVVADHAILPQEEIVLKRIARALERSEDSI